MRAPGVGQRSILSALGGRREMGSRDIVRRENMEDGLPRADQVVGDEAPMALPPQGFRAHDRAALRTAQLAQHDEAGMELVAHGVVGVVVKALVRPEGVHGRRDVYLSSPETSESGDVLIADRAAGQRPGKHVLVELRIRARARNGPNVDDQPHLRARQQLDELGDRSGGVADGEKRERSVVALGHRRSRLSAAPMCRATLSALSLLIAYVALCW